MSTSISDLPTSKDLLGIEQYTEGLKSFIETCSTPLSISIQGDWGIGKTSMMRQVQEKLNKNCKTIWFNTWQFSQFNLTPYLSVQFLSALVKEIESKDESKELYNQAIKVLKTISSLTKIIDLKGIFGKVGINYHELSGLINPDIPNNEELILQDLKKDFENLISNFCKEEERLVVFIDDLDRISPKYAVELLEIMKLFLDSEKCVFVIAIDESIVKQGLREKYSEISDVKQENFFEKIIQVPFNVPYSNYNLNNYIRSQLEAIKVNLESEGLNKIEEAIKVAIGSTPRTINRIINLYSLSETILSSEGEKKDEKKKDEKKMLDLSLMYLTILRCAFPEEYRKLDESRSSYIDKLIGSDQDENQDDEFKRFAKILKDFIKENEEKNRQNIENRLNVTSVFTINKGDDSKLIDLQEEFWKEFVKNFNIEDFPDYKFGRIGKRNLLYINSKIDSRIIEMYLNRKSLRINFGTYRKKNGSTEIEKLLEEHEPDFIDSPSDKINNTNSFAYYIKDDTMGLDLSEREDIELWFAEKIKSCINYLDNLT